MIPQKEGDVFMGKFGKRNGDSKSAEQKKIKQQLAALARRQAKKKKK